MEKKSKVKGQRSKSQSTRVLWKMEGKEKAGGEEAQVVYLLYYH